jgi:choline monooxygenase
MSLDLSLPPVGDALAADLVEGYTLPASVYLDPSGLRQEMQVIFGHHWQFAGLLERLTHPGDFFTYWSGDVPILVLRDLASELRGFINVCRHRGSQIVLDRCGSHKSIQCHYHAWTWNLDGTLRAAPGSQEQESFDKSEFPLIPVQVDAWGPFIFVNPDRTAPPLSHFLGALPQMVQRTGLALDAIRSREGREYVVEANWKIVVENYLECYHCPVAHPGFSSLIDVGDYRVDEFEYFSTQGGPVKESARRKAEQLYHFGAGVEVGFYAYLWPTFTVNIYPGPGNVSLNSILPEGIDRTRIVYEFCFSDEVSEQESRDFIAFINQVQLEDTALCESVQRGMRSGYWQRGKLMLSREHGLRHFQQLWHRVIFGR